MILQEDLKVDGIIGGIIAEGDGYETHLATSMGLWRGKKWEVSKSFEDKTDF